MKTTVFTLLLSLLTLTACASCTTQNDEEQMVEYPDNENQQENPDEVESKNVLVAFFSCTNTTRKIAEAYAVNKGTFPFIGVTRSYQVEEAALAAKIKLSPKEVSVLKGLAEVAGVDTKGAWKITWYDKLF